MQQNPINSNNKDNNSTKLLLEEFATISLRGKSKAREKTEVMKKQSNKLARRSSHLLDNFSEFLASRNVINRTSTYDILVSDNNDGYNGNHNLRLQQEQQMLFQEQVIFPETQPSFSNAFSLNSPSSIIRNNRLRRSSLGPQSDRHYFNQPLTYKYYDCLSNKKPGRVKILFSALFSRKQKNKTSLLLSLLRAPIVLAALFSLILVVTLMILYTMSFHHYDCHHHLTTNQQQQQQQQQLYHHINSRQLQQQQQTGERQQAEFDETSEKNASSDYSSLLRKLVKKNEELVSDIVSNQSKVTSQIAKSTTMTIIRNEEEEKSYERALTVQTECGSFVGSPEGQAIVFKGIAYASPPIGRRRWTRPRPVWQDPELCNPKQTKLALHSRIHCAQLSPVTRRFSGHEDCLYLDIFTPKLNDRVKKLPVMVYIHGGFLTFGSSGHGQVNWLKGRPSARLASELNVVLVSFNYRLQALGFMTLVQLARNNGPDGSEGNYGLWDQLTALNWIKRNIESFAGDSNNIVLFGPDSASALPLALISQQRQQLEEEVEATIATTTTSATAPQEIDIREKEDVKELRKEIEKKGRIREEKIENESSGNLVDVQNEKNENEADGLVNLTIKQEFKLRQGNRIDIDRKQGHQQEQQHVGLYSSRDLFRAVWLTNPTVYYEVPYEMASKHYQRLFLKQSPCSHLLASNRVSVESNISENSTEDGATRQTRNRRLSQARPQPPSDEMIECLLSLSSEQVVRHYLGKDDPSYRLDDQNSLPIHGIFADQFVTVDRELVRDSYPFTSLPVDLDSKLKDSLNLPIDSNHKDDKKKSNNSEVLDTTNKQHDEHEELTFASREQNETSNNDSDCFNSICNQNKIHLRPLIYGKDLLLGSTAQAVEYWPCPRNLNQWNWEEFERYVSTSLNSFSRGTFKKATERYHVFPEQLLKSNNNNGLNPKEVYLTMVSDIRQICPINELADSMLDRHHKVQRYIVETNPSNQAVNNVLPTHLYPSTTTKTASAKNPKIQKLGPHDDDDQDPIMSRYKPEFAYHTWDLFAFFGFESDPDFVPHERDLKFQFHIRQMVKRFVHRDQESSDSFSDSVTSTTKSSNKYMLYNKNGTTSQVSKYKFEECKMWREYIERSYAWVS